MRYFISSYFKNLSFIWKNVFFIGKKKEFLTHLEFCPHRTIFGLTKRSGKNVYSFISSFQHNSQLGRICWLTKVNYEL